MSEDRALVPNAPMTSAQVLQGLQAVRDVLAPDLTPAELKLFAMVAARSGLDPFAHQIYAVKRKGRVTFQTGIDGYRSIAARTGMYDGQDEPEFGEDCPCHDAPDPHPISATVRVYRKGVTRAIAASAFWHEYCPTDNAFMWQRMPHVMIAKVAEALALRKGFPYDPERREGIGADVYTADEMAQAENPPKVSARERIVNRAKAPVVTVPRVGPEGEVDDEDSPVDGAGDDPGPGMAATATPDPDEAPDASPAPVVAPVVITPATCGSVADDPVMEGAICDLKAGHLGAHRMGRGSWPR